MNETERDGELHKLLRRQLKRAFDGAPPAACGSLIEAVNQAYHQADIDRDLLDRSLELTSQELLERNDRLRRELAERERAQAELQRELEQRRHAEEALRRNAVRLDEAQRIARLGYWEWDVRSGDAFWSAETFRIFGFEPGDVAPSYDLFIGAVHPDDLLLLVQAFKTAPPRTPREVEFRITRPDAAERTLHASGEVVRDPEDHIVHIFGICIDVTERKRHEQTLLEARDQAEAAQARAEEMLRLKSAFLNNMSHELRTPLTGVLGFADILVEEVKAEHREFAELIARNARRLLDTLNSVLDLAQLKSGAMELPFEPVDLVAEVEETLALLQPLARDKGITLQCEARSPVMAWANMSGVRRILNNLVGNAIKFTVSGGVTVRVAADSEHAILQVEDTGIGIDDSFLPHLFEEFKQQSEGFERSHEGSGLGLAITKRLVELMQGRIEVASARESGSTFTVYFPTSHPRTSSTLRRAGPNSHARCTAH